MDQDYLEHAEVSLALLNLVSDLAYVLADRKDQLSLETIPTFGGYEVVLRAAPEDIPGIAGHKGRTADAMRLILNAAGVKEDMLLTFSLQAKR